MRDALALFIIVVYSITMATIGTYIHEYVHVLQLENDKMVRPIKIMFLGDCPSDAFGCVGTEWRKTPTEEDVRYFEDVAMPKYEFDAYVIQVVVSILGIFPMYFGIWWYKNKRG